MRNPTNRKRTFNHTPNWHRLDNAAKIYPSIMSERITTMFRISADLTKPVHVEKLQQALNRIMPRFPYYKVHLRPGFFWYYFEENPQDPLVEPDGKYPCMAIPMKKAGVFPFRVRAYYKTVAVEFSHALTDGTGALIFLKTLLAEYLRIQGYPIPETPELPTITELAPKGEFEDSFKKNYDPEIPKPDKKVPAFHIPGSLLKKRHYIITTGIIPIEKATETAKSFGVSLTEYLMAVYLEALQEFLAQFPPSKQRKLKNPIRLQIPVNLRPLYNSTTMRNFFLTVMPEIDPRLGHFTFKEILIRVRNFMQIEVNEKYINQQITRNVRGEIQVVNRLLPLPLKNLVLKIAYRKLGEDNTTSGISNLGKVTLPDSMSEHITRFDMYPPPTRDMKVKATVIGYKEQLHISFGRVIENSEIERLFFTRLRKHGIPIRIETNEEV